MDINNGPINHGQMKPRECGRLESFPGTMYNKKIICRYTLYTIFDGIPEKCYLDFSAAHLCDMDHVLHANDQRGCITHYTGSLCNIQ